MAVIELEISGDGTVRTMYDDKYVEDLREIGNELKDRENVNVERASNVEWEDGYWRVKAAHNPKLAIRIIWNYKHSHLEVSTNEEHEVAGFVTREAAITSEREHFWALLPPKE